METLNLKANKLTKNNSKLLINTVLPPLKYKNYKGEIVEAKIATY